MTQEKLMQTLQPQDSAKLCSMLQEEDRQYRRLLRLAWRQNKYMRHQDVDRLEKNAAEWQKYLPQANSARILREQYVTELGIKIGIGPGMTSPRKLLDYAAADIQQTVKAVVRELLSTTTKLARQSELNRILASHTGQKDEKIAKDTDRDFYMSALEETTNMNRSSAASRSCRVQPRH